MEGLSGPGWGRWAVTVLVPVAPVGAGWVVAGGPAGVAGWVVGREAAASLPSPPRPPGGQPLSPSRPPSGPVLASVSLLTLGGCLCYFNFVFLFLDWFPKWYFQCLGHLEPPLWGRITTGLTRNDPLGGPVQAWLRQSPGDEGLAALHPPTPGGQLSHPQPQD